MNITLTSIQELWCKRLVLQGEVASIEAAALRLIDERIAELNFEQDDFLWAKTSIDEALKQASLEKTIGLEEHQCRTQKLFDAMKS